MQTQFCMTKGGGREVVSYIDKQTQRQRGKPKGACFTRWVEASSEYMTSRRSLMSWNLVVETKRKPAQFGLEGVLD